MLNVVNNSLNFNHSLNLYNLFNNGRNFDYLRDLLVDIDDSLHDCWNLNYLVYDLFNGNYLFNYLGLNHRNLQGNVDYLLHLNDSLHFNDLLNLLHNRNHHRNLNTLLHNLLNDSLHLHNLRNWSENLQDIVHIHHSHYLRWYHTQHTLIHLQHNSSLVLYLLNLLQ